jgi:hypothetical protein
MHPPVSVSLDSKDNDENMTFCCRNDFAASKDSSTVDTVSHT